jgi:hypothetical protein
MIQYYVLRDYSVHQRIPGTIHNTYISTGQTSIVTLLVFLMSHLGHGTRRLERVVSSTASYSGGSGLKSRHGDQLSWPRILEVLRSHSKQMTGYCLKLDYDRFIPHHFQFIIH